MQTKRAPVLREIGNPYNTSGNVRLLGLIEREDNSGYELVVERVLTTEVDGPGILGFLGITKSEETEIKTEKWFSRYGRRWYHMPSGQSATRFAECLDEHLHSLFLEEYSARRMFKEEDN